MPSFHFSDFPMDELNASVFAKEPLRPDEEVVACWNGALFGAWTSGVIVTNQALLELGRKRVKRFDFAEMTDITQSELGSYRTLAFQYDSEPVQITLPTVENFHTAVFKALPEKPKKRSTEDAKDATPCFMLGCTNCGNRETVVSAEWYAGNKVDTQVVSTEGNTTTYKTTYEDIRSLTAGLCAACFDELAEKRLKSKKQDNLVGLIGGPISIAVGVVALTTLSRSDGEWFLLGLGLIILGLVGLVASVRTIVTKRIQKDNPQTADVGLHYLRPLAEKKMRVLECDTLWTPEEFKKLRLTFR